MMTDREDEILALLKKMDGETGRTLASHKEALTKLNDNLAAAFKTAQNHAAGITANREALVALTELVNAQTRAFNILREVTIKLWEHAFGPDVPPEVPTQIQ
jgi:hypothetical protein